MPQGFQNGKLPNSAFTSDTHSDGNDAFRARLYGPSKWCPMKAGILYTLISKTEITQFIFRNINSTTLLIKCVKLTKLIP